MFVNSWILKALWKIILKKTIDELYEILAEGEKYVIYTIILENNYILLNIQKMCKKLIIGEMKRVSENVNIFLFSQNFRKMWIFVKKLNFDDYWKNI